LRAVLGFLAYEPYGLYANEVNTAALAFALRPYINKIFQANSGIKITPDQMGSKVVKLLDSFDNGGLLQMSFVSDLAPKKRALW